LTAPSTTTSPTTTTTVSSTHVATTIHGGLHPFWVAELEMVDKEGKDDSDVNHKEGNIENEHKDVLVTFC
jgi:ribosomal protein L31